MIVIAFMTIPFTHAGYGMHLSREFSDPLAQLGHAARGSHIETGVEQSVGGKVDMGVSGTRKQRSLAENLPGRSPMLRRKIVSYIKNPAFVFRKVFVDMIVGIAGVD